MLQEEYDEKAREWDFTLFSIDEANQAILVPDKGEIDIILNRLNQIQSIFQKVKALERIPNKPDNHEEFDEVFEALCNEVTFADETTRQMMAHMATVAAFALFSEQAGWLWRNPDNK